MCRECWVVVVLMLFLPENAVAITHISSKASRGEQCASRLQDTLDAMRSRPHPNSGGASVAAIQPHTATLSLDGYALHKPLRSAPYDMYVTGMQVRVPGKLGWYHVERCRYDPRNSSVDVALRFHELTVSGTVRLYEEGALPQRVPARLRPVDTCNMTLRLRRASLDLTARSQDSPRDVQTTASFSEPQFLSVYAYGCRPPPVSAARSLPESKQAATDMTQEMEDVFVRGTRSLLGAYMERQLQQALRDTLMSNMGYTISYGR